LKTKETIMTASKILSPVLAAVLVTAGASAFAGGYNNYPELPQPTSTLTRAQVQADLVQAAKNGTLEMNDATYPVVADSSSGKTRADVQRELHATNQTAAAVVMQD